MYYMSDWLFIRIKNRENINGSELSFPVVVSYSNFYACTRGGKPEEELETTPTAIGRANLGRNSNGGWQRYSSEIIPVYCTVTW